MPIVMTAPTGTGPYTAELYLEGSGTRTASTALTEVGTLGQYVQGAFVVDAGGTIPDGRYWVRFLDSTGIAVNVTGGNLFIWQGGQELDNASMSADLDAITTALNAITTLSQYGALRVQGNHSIDPATGIVTLTGVGATAGVVVRKQMRNASGVADAVKVYSEEVI